MIQPTSLEAFESIQPSLNVRQQQIYDTIKNYPSISNLSISRILGLPINCVTPRVKELRDLGLVVFNDVKKDRVTGRRCMCWKIKEEENEGCLKKLFM